MWSAPRRACLLVCCAVFAFVAPSTGIEVHASAELRSPAASGAAAGAAVEDWDEFRTKVIANYASATYCDIDFLQDWSCARCNDGFKLLEARLEGDLQFLVGLDGYLNAVVVAFRGTIYNSIANWMRDMHFTTAYANEAFKDASLPGNSTVHKGFLHAYGNLREHVNAAVLDAVKQTGLVIVSGHSMGGAVATIAAAEFVSNLQLDNVWLYTFGSPRTGDYSFTQWLRSKLKQSVRVTHDEDIVPTIPPTGFPFHYWHIGYEVWERSHKDGSLDFRICDGTGEDQTCQDSICWSYLSCKSLDDHYFYMDLPMETSVIPGERC